MAEIINNDEMASIFEAELQDIQLGAEKYFIQFLKEKGLVLTGALQQSFKTSVIAIASDLYAEIKVSFQFNGRFLDLKTLNYKGGHPDPEGALVEGMKMYIEKIGLGNFKGIPGYYGSSVLPITSVAINRLAYSMAQSRINKGVIRRKGDGWYNKGRGIFVRDVRRTLQNRIAEFMLAQISTNMNDEIN